MSGKDMMLAVPRPVKTYHKDTYDRLKNSGFDGKGKTVFITGGATGIGFATAKSFATAGVERIVLVARRAETLETAKEELSSAFPNTKVITYATSLSDHARMKDIFTEIQSIDVLILSAHLAHPLTPPHTVETSRMEEIFMTNVIGNFNLIKLFLALPMPTSGGQKTVLSITSAAAQMYVPGLVGYSASKAAFCQIIHNFAMEENSKPERERTRFFTYHPGAIVTEALKRAGRESNLEDWNEKHNIVYETVELPADFAVWLAGPESDFSSGRYLWAEWDVDELIGLKGRIEGDSSFLTIGLVQ